jgi:C1A family cysteine protease
MKIARYGWIPQLPDRRDLLIEAGRPAIASSIDLSDASPPPYDQGELGSCTGNATARAIAYARAMQGLPEFTPSRLMLYYDARKIEGTTAIDAGASIRDVIKGAAASGAAPESAWPYDPAAFATGPPPAAYAAATKDEALGYRAVPQTLDAIRATLAGGDPIVFGFTVYESFEGDEIAKTGNMAMPGDKEAVVGGHAVFACGYNDDSRTILVCNSWGSAWGASGYFRMPYEYITNVNLASDFWTIRLVTP